MKFNITETDIKNILEMHSDMKKKIITEQIGNSGIDSQLQVFVDNGCVVNGVVTPMTTTNPQKKFAIKQESTKTPGKFRYYFIDFSYGTIENGEFVMGTTKWKCNSKSIDDKTNQTTNISRTKEEGDWKEIKDITDTVENINNPKMYEKKVVNGVTLYRSIVSRGIASGLTEVQKNLIKKYIDKGYKLRKDLDSEESKTWQSEVVSPASEGIFSQDLIMYFSPSNVVGAAGTSIEDQFNKAINSQTPTSKGDCRDTIKAYYEAWKTKKRIEPNTFNPMKSKVQACANEFEGKWGGVLSSIDNYITTLRGGSGGPLSYGDDAKWRLK
jgi:hypothetical protein